jgi:hypothetical protein
MIQSQPGGPLPGMPPTGVVQAGATSMAGMPSGVVQAGGPAAAGLVPGAVAPPNMISPPGVPSAPGMPAPPVPGHATAGLPLPPGAQGPGGGMPFGAVAAAGALPPHLASPFPSKRTSVRFAGPAGMRIAWYVQNPDGTAGFTKSQLEAPARYNFNQAAIYRLKLSNIPNRPALELYPTLEVVPTNGKTDAFVAHSSVPVFFTEEDFDQVAAGNYVVKVIYLPDPQFQDLAVVGPDEVVSTRLEPGIDPIAEACRRGSILLVVRMGNIDLEAPNTPPMDAPNPYLNRIPGTATPRPMVPGMMPPGMGMGPGAAGQGPMVPYGAAGMGRPMMPGMGAPMMGNPAMQPGRMLPPAMPTGSGMPQQPAVPGVPLTKTSIPGTQGSVASADGANPGVQQVVYNIPSGKGQGNVGNTAGSSWYSQTTPGSTGGASTPAQLASQDNGLVPPPDTKLTRERRWWFGSKSTGSSSSDQ